MVGNQNGSEVLRCPSWHFSRWPCRTRQPLSVWKDGAFLGLLMDALRACALPASCLCWQQLWAIKIWERTGIIGIQVNCGDTGFWNGAACVRLVLRNRVRLGGSRFLFKVRPPFARERKTTVFNVRVSIADSCPLPGTECTDA